MAARLMLFDILAIWATFAATARAMLMQNIRIHTFHWLATTGSSAARLWYVKYLPISLILFTCIHLFAHRFTLTVMTMDRIQRASRASQLAIQVLKLLVASLKRLTGCQRALTARAV